MCGICGIIYSKAEPLNNLAFYLNKMSKALAHRGPDDEGFVLFNNEEVKVCGSNDTNVMSWNLDLPYSPNISIKDSQNDFYLGIAHRRLSIIDLSGKAHLPMCSKNKRYWITYNGEIYNFQEIKSTLIKKGHAFITSGDTEVILTAFEEWGNNCFRYFDGMWALAIYDTIEKKVILSRDRFGVKPLFYYHDEKYFVFASEIKALIQLPFVKTDINDQAIFEHLCLSQTELHEEGFFKNIMELPPSHNLWLDIKNEQLKKERYYQLAYNSHYEKYKPEKINEYAAKTRILIQQAVESRLIADVPVGFCLSGGLDSTSIVCIANEINKKRQLKQLSNQLSAFTAVHGYKDSDETYWAEKVANFTACSWYKINCSSSELIENLENIIYHQDIPLFSTSTYAQANVMKLAKQTGVKILLDGQGGDEIFGGYPVFYISFYAELIRKGAWGRFISEIKKLHNSPLTKMIVFKSFLKILFNAFSPKLIKPWMLQQLKSENKYIQAGLLHQFIDSISISNEYSTKSMNEQLFTYQTENYLKKLLRFEDRCSMQYSIESRTPFSDDRKLIEYIYSLPESYKIYQGWSKWLLRQSMKGLIPEEIRLRTDKKGFSTPPAWLKEISSTMKTVIIESEPDHYVDKKRLLNDWNSIFEHNQVNSMELIWRYFNYVLWKKIFFQK